jgi:hypothetical protein
MKIKTTVYTLASDDDSGTSAEVFTTEREAVERLVGGLKYIFDADEETVADLIAAYFDNDRDFYAEIAEFKSDYDTYSIDQQTLIVDGEPTGENNEAVILCDALSYWLDKLECDVESTNDGTGWPEINAEIETVKSLIARL